MKTRVGRLDVSYSSRGNPTYSIELWHDGLKKHRVVKGAEREIVLRKVELQSSEWDEKWVQVSTKARERQDKEGKKQQQEANKKLAADRSAEAQAELDRLRSVLAHTLAINDAINWDDLKNTSAFAEPAPVLPVVARPVPKNIPREPRADDQEYAPQFGFLDQLLAARRQRIILANRQRFEADHARWEQEATAIRQANATAEANYQKRSEETLQKHQAALKAWEDRRNTFLEQQRLGNEAIDKQHSAYLAGSSDAITEYCDLVLSFSDYPDYFPQEYNLEYNAETRILVVEYTLPAPDQIPTLSEVRYVASRDEFTEQHLSQVQSAKLYDDLLYQIALRTVHELFEADQANALAAVAFNGYVTSVDRSSGKEVTACILSLQVRRDEFEAINLANVDPKACFKALKGVGSSKLHSLTPVAPIVRIRRDDPRFVSAHEVANTLDESYNLAMMDWEDFEHLIREVFEKEFTAGGGEVKVTQASRDGGVDAVAFDPDPIKGGKIVIQAKRYTHTVGVAAVRDLYGTVVNEGANKGILVTTSDYGPDAYAFANGKPLTLLSGANLLHMLEKHGHKARIDLREARQAGKDQASR